MRGLCAVDAAEVQYATHVSVSVVVCAHHSRTQTATALGEKLQAPIVWDDGTVGILENHDRAFLLAALWPRDWCVVIEDDAVPVEGFRAQASLALDAVTQPVASLYFGYVGQPRRRISQALERADPHWVMKPGLTNAVCVAIRTELVEPLITKARETDGMTCDQRYSWAAKQLGHQWVPHSHPSLVEHSDIPGTGGACGIPRHAYSVGSRLEWSSKHVRFWERVWD